MRSGMMVLTVLAITACGSLKAQSDRERFDALCEQEAGLHVYRTVKADEIFSESDFCGDLCPITLVDSQAIQRIGFCSSKDFGPWKARQPLGCYVYEKGLKGDPECFTALEGSFQIRINKDFFASQCVRLMPLKEKSRYRERSFSSSEIVNPEIRSMIFSYQYEIYDSSDGSILVRNNSFDFVPRNYRKGIENHKISCKKIGSPSGLNPQAKLWDFIFR